ncbi:MAG: prolyl oligopeptidase family serine peptidase [Myxococcota bacterium]|nr:prolyl oligopeptidase family serine peptidase [Myxococcota bacterium]
MLFLLLACTDTATPLPSSADTADAADSIDSGNTTDTTDTTDENVSGLSLQESGVCGIGGQQEPEPGDPNGVSAPSPFGTGSLSSVLLGSIVDSSAIVQSPASGVVDYSMDLESETFDLYIPPDYDGSEPYGLLVYISASNNGRIPSEWMAALDAHRLIWIGGEGIGNDTGVDERMGLSVIGAYRALEQFNIDRSRVYATGQSGGGRSASVMAWHHPALFPAAMPLCGSAYFRAVDQDYETQEPDSYYEYWGASYYPDVDGEPFAAWASAANQRFALLTSFDDFREGDIMNIVHNGLEPDGFSSRLLEGAGGHCATSTTQASDALAFLDHPLFSVIDDDFSDGILLTTADGGSGFLDASSTGTAAESDGLQLSGEALAVGRDRIHLDDDGGAILRLTVAPESLDAGTVSVGLWAYDGEVLIDTLAGLGMAAHPGVVVTLSQDAGAAVITLTASGIAGEQVTLMSSTLSDWDGTSALSMKLQVWSAEIQLDIGAHVAEVLTATTGVRLLDDARTIRARLDELPASFTTDDWADGALLALSTSGSSAQITGVQLQDAVGALCEAPE